MTKWLKWRPDQWLPEVEEGTRVREKWMWLQKDSMWDHCVDGNVLTVQCQYPDYGIRTFLDVFNGINWIKDTRELSLLFLSE